MTASGRIRWGRYGYLVVMGCSRAASPCRCFFAGMAAFVDPSNWARHVSFVHLLEPLLFPALAAGVLGRLPRDLQLAPVGLFALLTVQYATAIQFGSPVAALHPVTGVLLRLVAVWSVVRARNVVSGPSDRTPE